MATPEADRLQQAQRAFGRGRIRLALVGALATIALMLLGLLIGSDTKSIWFGAALMVLATSSLYFGRAPGRAVLPAFVIGLIPFSALIVAQVATGHGCHVGGCTTFCMPTCVASGLVAGGLIAFVGVRTRATVGFILAGGTMTWLVGALGCPCIGISSVLGMAAGIALPAISVLSRLRRAS